MKAEKLFLGNILTMDERCHFFKAMTVTGGKVTYVGSESIARQLCDENRIGKLDIGYAADMTVYDVDFLNDDIEKTVTAKHIATIVNGEIVWKD